MPEIPPPAASPEDDPCLVCGSATTVVIEGLQDNRFGAPGTYAVRACPACGCWQTSPRLDQDALNRVYESHYNFGGHEPKSYAGFRERLYESALYRLWLWIDGDITFALPRNRQDGPRPRLLDVGCNEGRGLQRFAANGFEVTGLELNPLAAEAARQRGFEVISEPVEQSPDGRRFDVVVLSNVLEHSLDPNAMLEALHRLLEPGGALWISLPNRDSQFRRLFGRSWINWHVPYHITHFNAAALSALLERHGFRVISCCQETPALWPAQSLIAHLFGRSGQPTRALRSIPLLAPLILLIRGLGFLPLWLLHRQGRGDALVVRARREPVSETEQTGQGT